MARGRNCAPTALACSCPDPPLPRVARRLTNQPQATTIEELSRQTWACGAAGSALPWHGRGRRFDPDQVHQIPSSANLASGSLATFGISPAGSDARIRLKKKGSGAINSRAFSICNSDWLRGLDLNQRPLGYEPNELPGCSTPHLHLIKPCNQGQSRTDTLSARSEAQWKAICPGLF